MKLNCLVYLFLFTILLISEIQSSRLSTQKQVNNNEHLYNSIYFPPGKHDDKILKDNARLIKNRRYNYKKLCVGKYKKFHGEAY